MITAAIIFVTLFFLIAPVAVIIDSEGLGWIGLSCFGGFLICVMSKIVYILNYGV